MEKKVSFVRRLFVAIALAAIGSAAIVPAANVHAAGTLLRTGNYVYSPSPNAGNTPDNGAAGLVSSASGALLDGSSSTYAGWMGSATAPGTVRVVFDLLKDYPLDHIDIVLNAPNKYWGYKDFTVTYRAEAQTDYYYIAGKHADDGASLNDTVTVPMANRLARFVVITIKRSQPYQHIPLNEVQFYEGDGQEGANPGPALTAAQMTAELSKDARMADRYGQWIYESWPDKITSDAELQAAYTNELNALSDVSLDTAKYDQYGGIKSGGHYSGTGYFRLQQIDNKWWFITPDGYKFILKGVDASSMWEWGYGTPYLRADGSQRQVFEELPDPSVYAPAYADDANGKRVSFVVANIMKKYGTGYEAKWEDMTRKRLIDWGFNAFSKWTKPNSVTFPYITVLQDPASLKRIQWTYDVFDPQAPAAIESALSAQLDSAKNDPWLIGYTYDNEAGWTADIVKEVLTYDSSSAAKRAFVDFVAPRYGNNLNTVNQLLGTSAASFDALKDIAIDIGKVPAADVSEYIKLASDTYFSTIKTILTRHDPNHLFLGTTVVPTWRTSLEWDSQAMPYVDAFSVDDYTNDAGWIARYRSYGKPLLNLEYTFSTNDRGLSSVNAATAATTIAGRGTAFRSFVESETSDPLFVGSGWFSYYDQAVTGRKDGESFNIGLVNQQDQPYTDMADTMKTVNAGLENVHEYGINLALNRQVTASSFKTGLDAKYAVDGAAATRWGSNYTDNEWIEADLGATQTVGRVRLNWETAYGKQYKIQVSDDDVNWTDVYATNAGDGGTDDIAFAATNARYVRMQGIQRGTVYGYSLWEFEVYAPPADDAAPAPIRVEAENYSSMMGVAAEACSDSGGGNDIGSLQPGDWAAYSNIDLTGMNRMEFRVASVRTGTLRVRLGSPTGTVIGTLQIASTGGWQNWTTATIPIAPAAGPQTIYLTFERPDAQAVGNINYFTIMAVDDTAPATAMTIMPSEPDGRNGWYVHPASVSLAATDDRSGVTRTVYSFDGGSSWHVYADSIILDQDAVTGISYRSTDAAGNVEAPRTSRIQVDMSAPTVTASVYEGQVFGDDQPLILQLSVADSLSGTDPDRTGVTLDGSRLEPGAALELYPLALGTHTLNVTASDVAGNVRTLSVQFRTEASMQSLHRLVTIFRTKGWIDNDGVETSLLGKLDAGTANSFANEVKAQSGKHISGQAAQYLLRDAESLLQ